MISLGAILAFLAIVTGAFGAHGLEKTLEPHMLEVWKTASYYQFMHALALILLGLYEDLRKVNLKIVRNCFILGILIFSGSLYALALSGIKILGAITPIGGLSFMAGWLAFAWAARPRT